MIRLRALGVDPDQIVLQKLAEYCASLEYQFLSTPWDFAVGQSVSLPLNRDPVLQEKQLMSWALSGDKSLEWLDMAVPKCLEPDGNQAELGFQWREPQVEMLQLLNAANPDAVVVLEGSTGIGKTRATCKFILDTLSKGDGPCLLAVPTVAVARQWIAEMAEVDPNAPIQPVLGVTHYASPKDQLVALRAAASAPLVICTQHMLLQVMGMQRWRMVIDEAHLLAFAVMATAGQFWPIASMGERFESWCRASLGLQEGVAQEVLLKGRMRQAVLTKAGLDASEATQVSAYAVVQADGGMGVCVREAGSAERALQGLWQQCSGALLLSATQSMTSSAGVRSTRLLAERLCIPAKRLHDLGRIKAPWRDSNVIVKMPMAVTAGDGQLWLSPHAKRKDAWFEEVAEVMARWSGEPNKKTLLLATSYEDVAGISEACKRRGIKGVVASSKKTDIQELQQALATPQIWCWIATGAAWTGMDLGVPLSRLVIARLPLQQPDDEAEIQDLAQLRFDCVNRLRQGVGRLVRGKSDAERELVLLDGRINERSRWWRGVVQPYMQVFAEDYEEHERFGLLM